MPTTDKRVDAYIAKAPDYARPILTHLRAVVHEGCPDCEETLKWGMPAFMHHGILCQMAAFKGHAIFGFWKGSLITDPKGKPINLGMGKDLGKLTSLDELPSKKALIGYVKQAMKLNEAGVTVPRRTPKPKPPAAVPPDLAAALRKNKKAQATFEAFSPSAKRDYVEWVTGAKADDTRARRLAQAVQWMAEGKQRNWKYM